MTFGGIVFQCGFDRQTGDWLLRIGRRRSSGAGVAPDLRPGRPTADDLGTSFGQPKKGREIVQALAGLAPADLRRLRLAAVWRGTSLAWALALCGAAMLAAMAVCGPLFVAAVGFMLKGEAGLRLAWDVILPAGARGAAVFVPLFLAVRWAAARAAPLPLENEYAMRDIWRGAFQR